MEFQYDYQYSRVRYIMRTMIFYHFSKKKKKENVQNVQIFKHSGFHLHSIRVYSRQYIKPFGFRLDFYHSTIVFLRIKKIDIPPSETLFHFFFFHQMLLDSSLLYSTLLDDYFS